MHGLLAEKYAQTTSKEGPSSIRTATGIRSTAGKAACQLEFRAAFG